MLAVYFLSPNQVSMPGYPTLKNEEDDKGPPDFDPSPINLNGDYRMINLSSGSDPRMIPLSGGQPGETKSEWFMNQAKRFRQNKGG